MEHTAALTSTKTRPPVPFLGLPSKFVAMIVVVELNRGLKILTCGKNGEVRRYCRVEGTG